MALGRPVGQMNDCVKLPLADERLARVACGLLQSACVAAFNVSDPPLKPEPETVTCAPAGPEAYDGLTSVRVPGTGVAVGVGVEVGVSVAVGVGVGPVLGTSARP